MCGTNTRVLYFFRLASCRLGQLEGVLCRELGLAPFIACPDSSCPQAHHAHHKAAALRRVVGDAVVRACAEEGTHYFDLGMDMDQLVEVSVNRAL